MRRSEETDFRVFVTARMDAWRRAAFLLSRDWHTADDLVAITVGKLYRYWREVSQAANPDAYAHRVLTRSWLDERRRPWRREAAQESIPDSPHLVPDRVVDREPLAAALAGLGARQRAVVVLRFYLDHSVEETAALLGISVGTVKSQSARGLETLRALLAASNDGGI